MKNSLWLCFLVSIYAGTASAQPTDSMYRYFGNRGEKFVSLLTGYNLGSRHFGELGIAVNEYGISGHHPYAWSYFLSSELRLNPYQELIAGPKVGAWIAGGFAMGGNLVYYTSRSGSSLCFRPECGIGIENWKLVYGYNFRMTGRNFEGISSHNLNITYLIGLKKTRTIN